MKIGYQGIPGSYSEQAILEYLGNKHELVPIKNFENTFASLAEDNIEYALIPIENSYTGSLHTNYDLITHYNLKIIGEYNLPVNHCLITNKENNIESIKYITSHTQALQQSSKFIQENNFIAQDFYDTAGSVKFIKENKSKNVAAIASYRAAKLFDMKILQQNIQNDTDNVTRFLLLTTNYKYESEYIPNKISIVFGLLNDTKSLSDIFTLFSKKKINIIKVESRPNKNKNINCEYLFYIDLNGNLNDNKTKDFIEEVKKVCLFFNIIGNYASLSPISKPYKKLKIGIVGFGRFGQFLAENIKKYHNVIATSRNNYLDKANELNIPFINDLDVFMNQDLDIIIFSVSILSFSDVINSIDKDLLEGKLLVDVLSVKDHAKSIFLKLNLETDILCTHPMFGPDSAKLSWNNLPFIYEKVRINDIDRCELFLNFFKNMGCKCIEMNCSEHDNYSANSQFITHFIGRILKKMNVKSTPINTKGYENLLDVMNNTCNDSNELFEGLYNNNNKSLAIVNSMKDAINNIINDINKNNKNNNFDTGFSNLCQKYCSLQENSDSFLNHSIGIPDFDINYQVKKEGINTLSTIKLKYTNVLGLEKLRESISKYLKKEKNLDYSSNEILCTSGGKFGIYQTLLYLCNNNDEIIIPNPSWPVYNNIINLIGAKAVFLDTKIDDNFQINKNKLESLINKKTKAIILNNPNNPTGTIYDENTLKMISEVAIKNNLYVISDEVYELMDFYDTHRSIASFENMKERTFTINSFSKGFSMSGLRLGYIAAPESDITLMKKIQANTVTCPNIIAQRCAIEALENLDYFKDIIKKMAENASYMHNQLNLLPNIKCNYPLGSMYLFPDVSYYYNKELDGKLINNSFDFCELLMDKYKIGLIPGDYFNAPKNIRISFGSDNKPLKEIIVRLNNLFSNYYIEKSFT